MRAASASVRPLPPGPRGVPILGVLPALRRDPTGVFIGAARRFGDVVYLKIGPQRGFPSTNPADVRHVLQDNARNYHKSPLYAKLRTSLGNGLLTSEDDFRLRQRRIAQPAFHRHRIVALAGVMADAARETADRWQSIAGRGEPADVDEEMMHLTRTVVLRALLGADLGPFAATIDNAWTIINEHIGESFWSLGLTERLPTARRRRFEEARTVLRGAVDHVIDQRRRRPSEDRDLLSMLLSARDDETGEGMTDEQARVEVTTFLLAGHETTSLALTWTWYLLSQHPESQRRLEQEIDAALGGRPPHVLGPRESTVYAHGDRRSDAPVPSGVGLLAASARRRSARRITSYPAVGSRSSSLMCCIAFPHSRRIETRSIRTASCPNAVRIGPSSCICRSAQGRDSASETTSLSSKRT